MLNNKPWYHKEVDFKLLDTCSKILYGIGEPEECGGSEVREESMWVPDTPHTAVLTFALTTSLSIPDAGMPPPV